MAINCHYSVILELGFVFDLAEINLNLNKKHGFLFTKIIQYFSIKYNFIVLGGLPRVQGLLFVQRWTINAKFTPNFEKLM